MCGRYTLTLNPATHAAQLGGLFEGLGELPWEGEPLEGPRYNVSPTQEAPVIRMGPSGPKLSLMRWGLLPEWMAGRKGAPLINARAETVAEKPAFRGALRHRRCLIPADGFFEWAPVPEGAPKSAKKQPWWFRRADGGLFALAGLWEPGNAEAPHGSYTLITTEPNGVVSAVHDRMPVILSAEAYARWLDPELADAAALVPLLRPYPAEGMTAQRASVRLNATHGENDPSLLRPDPPPPPELKLF